MAIKALLAALTFLNLVSFIFVIVATGVTDWSKSTLAEYGIWNVCDLPQVVGDPQTCTNWEITEATDLKACEGALTATRAFSVMSIIFTFFCLAISGALTAVPTLIKKSTVLLNLCMVVLTSLWLFLGWIMYLGVEARGQCAWDDYDTHLGSSWFLQLFAWIINFLLAIPLAFLIFLKWKKTPRFAGQPPYVPGPAPAAPYGPPSAAYPQYNVGGDKAAYYPAAPSAAPYSGYIGPTPNTSPYAPQAGPYVPAPYW